MKLAKILLVPITALTLLSTMPMSIGTVIAQDDVDYSTGTVVTHTVKAGEYLYKIANDYGVTVNELRLWNHLTSDNLQIGQQLKIIPNTQTPPPSGSIYTVKSGDTLWRIANMYGVTVSQLKKWNGLSSDFLSIGMQLHVSATTTPPPVDNGFTYTVKAGDTLWGIGSRYGVSVSQLKAWNNLSSDMLSIGMTLIVEGTETTPPAQGTVYQVKSGDTLWNIAYRYGTTVSQLKAWNSLNSDVIYVGSYLRVSQP